MVLALWHTRQPLLRRAGYGRDKRVGQTVILPGDNVEAAVGAVVKEERSIANPIAAGNTAARPGATSKLTSSVCIR